MNSEEGNCRTGVEMLTLDYIPTQPVNYHRRKRARDGTEAPPTVTAFILSQKKFNKRMEHTKQMYECQRELHSEQVKDRLTLALHAEPKVERPYMAPFVIEGTFMMTPDSPLSDYAWFPQHSYRC